MKTKTKRRMKPGMKRVRVSSLKPSPENTELYRTPWDDPDIQALADSIKRNGLIEPPVVTLDGFIVSGHRRITALKLIGQQSVTVRVLQVRRRSMSKSDYIALLREYNRQREKTVAEKVREELVDVDPSVAHHRLRQHRNRPVCSANGNGFKVLKIEGTKKRYGISADKADHVKFIKRIVFEDRRIYWPLSVRGVHYPLLNFDFIRGFYWPKRNEPDFGTKRELKYVNDQGSYDATSDLITRLRLNGEIPWEAFDDPTRPIKEFHAFQNVRDYVQQEVTNLFTGYWRDYMQSQPHYYEVVVEKNTVYHMALRATEPYQIFTSSGRGFNSIDPWHDLYERYESSGKDKLVVIILSDHDPEGEMIPIVAGRTLRDDFGVDEDDLKIIKAGVTRPQIEKYKLPPQNFAKETSSNYDWYVERNQGDSTVWELESLDPQDMIDDLERVITSVIDMDLYNREVEQEEEEAAYLESARENAVEALKGLGE